VTDQEWAHALRDALFEWFKASGQPMQREQVVDGRRLFDLSDLSIRYMQLLHRRIHVRPWNVRESAALRASPLRACHAAAVDALLLLATSGGDLNPYLSNLATSTGKDGNDGLLNDWGINHLHLSPQPDRTNELLFVVVRGDVLYVLDLRDHGSFEDIELFYIMEAEFPELVQGHRVQGITSLETTVSAEDRRVLRSGTLIPTVGKDGAIYFPPGGGATTSGRNMQVVDAADSWVRVRLDYLVRNEDRIRAQIGATNGERVTIVFDDDGQMSFRKPQLNRKARRRAEKLAKRT
jgi:hypothetical protein